MEAEERRSQRELLALVDVLDEMMRCFFYHNLREKTKNLPNPSKYLRCFKQICFFLEVESIYYMLYVIYSTNIFLANLGVLHIVNWGMSNPGTGAAEALKGFLEVPKLELCGMSTWIDQHIPKYWLSNMGGFISANIGHLIWGDEYSLVLLSWKDWAWRWFFEHFLIMMTPLPPILNIEIIFFDLCIYCLKSEALNWLSPGILTRMVPPPTLPATKNGQVHGVMGFVKQGLVAEVTRASISRAIKLLGWDIDGCWHKYLPFETITFGICASFQPISNIVDV